MDREFSSLPEVRLQIQLRQAEEKMQMTLWELAGFYSRARQPEKALRYVERLLAMTEEDGLKAQYCLAMGQLMEQQNNFAAAVGHYERALAMGPVGKRTLYFSNNNLGYSLVQLNRYEEAEAFCRSAILIEPRRYNAHKNLGLSLEGQGRYVEAGLNYIRAIECAPTEPRAIRHLSELVRRHPEIRPKLPQFYEKYYPHRSAQ